VFKKNIMPEKQKKKFHNYSTDYSADSVFMTTLLKPTAQKPLLQPYNIVEEDMSPSSAANMGTSQA
jgi:hypothetical protein